MFYFRINKLKIVDNRENPGLLRIFGRDRAEVKLNSFITTDQPQLPDFDELMSTNDLLRQRAILAAAVAQTVNSRVLTTIENVTDDHQMTFGDTGYVLFQAPRIPEHFSWLFLAIESDRDERVLGDEMANVVNDGGFDGFVLSLVSTASQAANPPYAAAVGISKFIANSFAQRMRSNGDDMVGMLYASLNRREHYPHGERKRDGVADLTNNMFVDYSIFGFDPPRTPPPFMQRFPVVSRQQPSPPLRRRGDPPRPTVYNGEYFSPVKPSE